jgi:linoleoyl-CoA desaturase
MSGVAHGIDLGSQRGERSSPAARCWRCGAVLEPRRADGELGVCEDCLHELARLAHAPEPITMAEIAACKPRADELRRARWRLRRKAAAILVTTAVSYIGLVFFADSLLLALPLAAVLAVCLVAVGTGVMHDANHGTFGPSRRWNRALAYSADVLGASSWFWRHQHNGIHHANTNVVGIDTDIEQMPFARLAPEQPWKPWHRFQHVYMWPLYGFMAMRMFLCDFTGLFTNRIGSQPLPRRPSRRDVAALVAGKLLHVLWALALPMVFHPWWQVLLFYVGISWVVGLMLATFFQLAHCNDLVGFAASSAPRRGGDFGVHQLSTTANVGTKALGRPSGWRRGGLNPQIEHHLAPGTPHAAYPAMAVRVRQLCVDHQVPYHVHRTFPSAVASHVRWLRGMGAKPPTPRSDAAGRADVIERQSDPSHGATTTMPKRGTACGSS